MRLASLAIGLALLATASSTPPYPVAFILHGCAPNDASSIRLTLAKSGKACGPKATNTITLSIWTSAPQVGKTYDVSPGKDGDAMRCPKPGHCDSATKASLRFDEFTDRKHAKGHGSATFENGDALDADFDAVFCDETPPPCG